MKEPKTLGGAEAPPIIMLPDAYYDILLISLGYYLPDFNYLGWNFPW